jgi:hypothetical protein
MLSTNEVICDDDREEEEGGVNGGNWILITPATGSRCQSSGI